STLETWLKAAGYFGDLREMRRVSAMLAADDAARGGPVAYEQRRMPALLAMLALRLPRAKDPAHEVERSRVRTEMLEQAGVDGESSDVDAVTRLLPLLDALL